MLFDREWLLAEPRAVHVVFIQRDKVLGRVDKYLILWGGERQSCVAKQWHGKWIVRNKGGLRLHVDEVWSFLIE